MSSDLGSAGVGRVEGSGVGGDVGSGVKALVGLALRWEGISVLRSAKV